jgi:hypothetical protein
MLHGIVVDGVLDQLIDYTSVHHRNRALRAQHGVMGCAARKADQHIPPPPRPAPPAPPPQPGLPSSSSAYMTRRLAWPTLRLHVQPPLPPAVELATSGPYGAPAPTIW